MTVRLTKWLTRWRQRAEIAIWNGEDFPVLAAANDNCFWKWLLGPNPPFDAASDILRFRRSVLECPYYFPTAKEETIDNCDTFLALFRAVYIENDEAKALALAPKLNRHIPDLMMRCPIRSVRPVNI